jgi:hypothetical protein
MADTKEVSPPKKRRGLRVVLWIFLALLVLLVVGFFVATSSAFFKGVVLPRVGASLNADITVSQASIHPFSQVVLRDLKVTPHGRETLLTAQEVRAKYHLFDIIRGNINVDEVALISANIHLVANPDGTRNLDPILESQKQNKPSEKNKTKSSKPTQLNIHSVKLTGASVRSEKIYANGNRDIEEFSNADITLNNLQNGQPGKADLSAALNIHNNPPPPGVAGTLQGTVKGEYDFTLSPNLKSATAHGQSTLAVTRAEGALAELSSLSVKFTCEVTPTEIKQLSVQFKRADEALGEVRVSGPFDMEKTEGRLNVEVLSLDKRVLNLVGAKNGVDFGTTTINSTNEVQLAKAGTLAAVIGRFEASKVQMIRTNQTTPMLDLRADYNVTVDSGAKSALLNNFSLTGEQNSQPLLKGELTSPMTFSWGNTNNTMGDSALNLTITNLNLENWKAFTGDTASAGIVNGTLQLHSQGGGQQLTFNADSQIANLTAKVGTNQISQATVTLHARGEAANLKQFNLTEYKVELAQQDQSALTLGGSGTYDTTTRSADMQIVLQAGLTRLLQLMHDPSITATSGTMELKAHVTQKQNAQTITGNLMLTDFTGRFGKNEFNHFGSVMDLDVNKTAEQIEIRKANGKLTQGENAGGSFEISGTYGVTNKPTQLIVKLTDFNQNGLRSFIEPMLADKKLVSISVNGNLTAQYSANGDSAVKGDVQVANLVVSDPKQNTPGSPLEAKLTIDAGVQKKSADVRQFQVTLTPTQRAKNQLQFQGHLDFAQANAMSGNLTLLADSLDVTSYYDLFAAQKPEATKSANSPAPQNAPGSAAPAVEKEPDGTTLPFRDLKIEAKVQEFYLREIAVTNLQTTIKVDGGHVLMNPFQLALNGAPMSATADVDLSVPGYKYAVTFNANQVPFTPLWNSFHPDEKGKVGGTLTAKADISGTGTTGTSLQKTLTGNFDIGTTNLHLDVSTIKSKPLKLLVQVVAKLPQLAQNPGSAVGDIASGVGGKIFGGSKGGLENELSQSPIEVITARGSAGSGKVDLQQAVVRSTVFEADAKGVVTLANALTNSPINIPVSISLNKAVAQRLSMVPANTPTNALYAKLPDFFTEKGTIGDPKADINKLALGKVMGSAAVGVAKGIVGTNSDTGKLLNNLGGLLNGGQSQPATSGTNQPTATAPGTNQSPVNDLLNQFMKPKKK